MEVHKEFKMECLYIDIWMSSTCYRFSYIETYFVSKKIVHLYQGFALILQAGVKCKAVKLTCSAGNCKIRYTGEEHSFQLIKPVRSL